MKWRQRGDPQTGDWERSDSNREPRDYESPALTVELRSRERPFQNRHHIRDGHTRFDCTAVPALRAGRSAWGAAVPPPRSGVAAAPALSDYCTPAESSHFTS